jgi:glycogen debranching enzyme
VVVVVDVIAPIKVNEMSDYIFRGKPIDGVYAWILLGSIKRVLQEAPNPTAEEVQSLEKIVADFEDKFEADMREDPWEEDEL